MDVEYSADDVVLAITRLGLWGELYSRGLDPGCGNRWTPEWKLSRFFGEFWPAIRAEVVSFPRRYRRVLVDGRWVVMMGDEIVRSECAKGVS